MDLEKLLICSSIAAGAHMVLFWGAATLAWIYFKRCKKLRAQIAQDEVSDDRGQDNRHEGRDNPDEESDHTDDHRRSRDGNRHRESATGRARRERRRHRDYAHRLRDDSSPYPEDDPENDSPLELRREQTRMTNSKRSQDKRTPRDTRGNRSA